MGSKNCRYFLGCWLVWLNRNRWYWVNRLIVLVNRGPRSGAVKGVLGFGVDIINKGKGLCDVALFWLHSGNSPLFSHGRRPKAEPHKSPVYLLCVLDWSLGCFLGPRSQRRGIYTFDLSVGRSWILLIQYPYNLRNSSLICFSGKMYGGWMSKSNNWWISSSIRMVQPMGW